MRLTRDVPLLDMYKHQLPPMLEVAFILRWPSSPWNMDAAALLNEVLFVVRVALGPNFDGGMLPVMTCNPRG